MELKTYQPSRRYYPLPARLVLLKVDVDGNPRQITVSREEFADFDKFFELIESHTGLNILRSLPPEKMIGFRSQWHNLVADQLENLDQRN